MKARSITAESDSSHEPIRANSSGRTAGVLGTLVFVSLLCLMALISIPYGTSQPWWKAFFVCAVFILAIVWLVDGLISRTWFGAGWSVTLPLAALGLFSFLQTLPLRSSELPEGLSIAPWLTLSADPYQTRFFAMQVVALMIAGLLMFRYAVTERRMRIMLNLIIVLALASAIFGILRQTTQHSVGFVLPLLVPNSGYAQFINYNHFAYLMEMALGVILGLVLGGGVRREQALIYVSALLPIWIGLVLCGSRGGLVAMVAQLIAAAILFGSVVRQSTSSSSSSKILTALNSRTVRVVLGTVLIAGVVVGTVWLGGDRLAFRVEQTQSEFEVDETRVGVSRNQVWQASWQLFKAHPILGAGMGAYWAAIPRFHNAAGTMTPQEAHNDYLELLASGGLIGLGLGIWFVVVVCKRTFTNLRSPHRFRRAACYGAAIGIVGVAVHSLVDFGLHMIVNALTFTTLIVIATSKPHWGDEPGRIYE